LLKQGDVYSRAENIKWLANYPADKIPEEVRKRVIYILPTPIPAFIFLYILGASIMLYIVATLFLCSILLLAFPILKLREHYLHVKYVAFPDKEIIWKTASGRIGKIPYSKVRSIARTGRWSFKDSKIVPLKKEIYTILTYLDSRMMYYFEYPPKGLVLNKQNTKILIEKLKEIDPELENVEISGWTEDK